ncbi:hypothetical protein ABT040_28990 [Streptomyces sp. NPDC002688]|uniref:hypothetical protein n=1 Tax=Streptomyces sp. NPDC002688 TaxID=3154423 RepID=UPI00331C3CDF
MASVGDLEEMLGPSPWGSGRTFDLVEREWGRILPSEFKQVGLLYGDSLVSDFLFLFGPKTIAVKGNWMSAYVKEGNSRIITNPVIPESGGMLYWGHSIDGDRLFLEDRGEGLWTVSAFRRDWGDWYESELPILDWLTGVFSGSLAADWMPEWPLVHTFETD